MPIAETGWELQIVRVHTQRRTNDRKARTVGRYPTFHAGVAAATLAGTTAESRGPRSNAVAGNGKRTEPGRYPLFTQARTKYVTLSYTTNANRAALPRPGIELMNIGRRFEILIHAGIGFLSAIGCIKLCKILPDVAEPISFPGSRARVIAVIEDMKAFFGAGFPTTSVQAIPGAFAMVDGEPA